MQKDIFIRVNGRANAWPVFLEQRHPFYSITDKDDHASTSYSIICADGEKPEKNNIKWEILIDSGHGSAQYLLKTFNRIPEAIVFTHAHPDHINTFDWIVQSFIQKYEGQKKFPVYATKPCWEVIKKSYGFVTDHVDFYELKPGVEIQIPQADGLKVRALPVFHGESAVGASMLVFEFSIDGQIKKAVFTGDILCPLLREKDYNYISDAQVMYVDTSNRFPYPLSGHWSFTGHYPDTDKISQYFISWREKVFLSYLIAPHLSISKDDILHRYFDQFLFQNLSSLNIPFNIIDFLTYAPIPNIMLVHYCGNDDYKHYGEDRLSETELKIWATEQANRWNIASEIVVPKVGSYYKM